MPKTSWHNNFPEITEKILEKWYAPRKRPFPVPVAGIHDEPLYCLKINADWLPHLLGVLNALDQADAWLGTDDDIYRARSEVNKLIGLIESCCGCEMKAIRQAPGRPSVMQYQDCDDLWHDAFDYSRFVMAARDPYDTGTQTEAQNTTIYNLNTLYAGDVTNIWSEANATGDGDRNASLCFGISLFVDAACEQAIAAIQNSDEDAPRRELGVIAAGTAVIAAGFALVSLVFPPAAWAAWAAANGQLAAGLIGLAALLIPDPEPEDYAYLENQQAREDVVCYVYGNLSAGNLDKASWDNAFVGGGIFEPDSDAGKILADIESAATGHNAYLAMIAAMSDAYNASIAGAGLPCPCLIWCYDFVTATGEQEWELIPPSETLEYHSGAHGTYVAGVGWQTGLLLTGSSPYSWRRDIHIRRLIEPVYIETIGITLDDVTLGEQLSSDLRKYIIRAYLNDALVFNSGNQTLEATTTPISYTFDINKTCDKIEVIARCGRANGHDPGGQGTLAHIILTGQGVNQFGDDNCS